MTSAGHVDTLTVDRPRETVQCDQVPGESRRTVYTDALLAFYSKQKNCPNIWTLKETRRMENGTAIGDHTPLLRKIHSLYESTLQEPKNNCLCEILRIFPKDRERRTKTRKESFSGGIGKNPRGQSHGSLLSPTSSQTIKTRI